MRLGVVACLLAVAAGSASASPRMLKGPYLQDLAPTSITVMWQLDAMQPARLVVDGPGGEKTLDVSAQRISEASVRDLQPSSRYRYRVEIGDQTWRGEFATAPPVGTDVPFSFVVMGDSRDGIEQHRRVIDRVAQEVPDFVLGTGDMVDDGSREDLWQQFFDVEGVLLRDNVYFPALGNHDRQGRGRTADTYRAYFSVPENGGETERYYAFSYAAARFLVLDSNEYSFALTDQTAWLERELIAARQDPSIHHVVVVMHHPPFSVSLHGGARDLRERWGPLFERYQVTMVLSGHDHCYERAEHDGIHYFVTGGAGAPLYPRRAQPAAADVEAVKKYERALHYLRVSVTADRIEVSAIRTDGTTIETTTWNDGPPPAPPVATPVAVAPVVAPVIVAPVGAAVVPEPVDESSTSLIWLGLGGVGLLLAAALVLVRTLRS